MGCRPLFDIPPKMHCMTHESSSSAVKFDHVSNVPVLQGKKNWIHICYIIQWNKERASSHPITPILLNNALYKLCMIKIYKQHFAQILSKWKVNNTCNNKSWVFSPENEQISVNQWKGITADLCWQETMGWHTINNIELHIISISILAKIYILQWDNGALRIGKISNKLRKLEKILTFF